MQGAPKAVWSIPYVSVAFFPSLKQNFTAHCSSKVSLRPDCIFEIHQLWRSGFSRVYSNSCCSCSFEPEILKICQSFHNMYSNKILNFQQPTKILNACTKKSGTILNAPRIYIYIYIYIWKSAIENYIYIYHYFIYINLSTSLFINISLFLSLNLLVFLHLFHFSHLSISVLIPMNKKSQRDQIQFS